MAKILVIGSINRDLVCAVDHTPLPGESVIGTQYAFLIGGKGANSAVAAARMGAAVTFAGRIGDDDNGKILYQSIVDEGIDVRHLTADPGAPSGFALILVESSGQNRIAVYPGANLRIDPSGLDALLSEPYDALLMQLEVNHDAIFEAARAAHKRGIPVILDAGPAQPFELERLGGLFVLSPNETEATALTGIPVDDDAGVRRAARALMERARAEYVVVKLGARGCYALGGGMDAFVPAFPIHAVDPTAAGDTFTGALAIELADTGDMRRALRVACAAGALCASRMGAQPSLPTRAEVDAFLEARA